MVKLTDKKQNFAHKSATALRKAAFFAFVLGAMALPAQGFANETSAENAQETGTVVVTATRTEQLLEDVSASMQIFTEEDIQKLGAANVTDVLRTVQGVQLGKKLGLRGMPDEGTTILINGRRPAGELKMGTGANRTTDRIDVNRIERIEILSGPSSALYGSTTGGVINIITKKSQEPSGRIGIEAGNTRIRNYYSVDSGKFGKFDLLANLSIASNMANQDWRVNDPATPFGEYEASASGMEFNGGFELGYDFNDDHRLTLRGDYFSEDYYTTSVGADRNGNRSYSKTYEEAQRYETALIYDGTIGDHMYSFGLSYGGLSEVLDQSKHTNVYQSITADFQDTWAINDQHTLTFGGQFKREMAKVHSAGLNTKDDSFAFYIQDEMRFFDETLILIPAIRYDNYEAWGGQWSPKMGLVWKFLEEHRFKANFGLGFRAPGVDELYRNSVGSSKNSNSVGYFGNPDLKPEESISWDIGYEGGYDNMTWGVTYFWNDVKNMIQGWQYVDSPYPGFAAGTGYETLLNISQARVQGIEAKFGIDFLDYFNFSANYTWLDSRDVDTGLFLDNAALHTLRLKLDFNQPDWGTTVSVWTETADHFYTDSSANEYTAFTTINVSVSQKVYDNFRVFASATNIGNALGSLDSYLDVAPMEWKVGMELTF